MATIDIILPYLLQDRAIPDRFRKEFITLIKSIDKKDDASKTSEEWFVEGYMTASQEQYDEAEDCFSEALRINPGFEAAWKQRGDMRLVSGASKYAIEDYTKAIELDPTYAAAYLKRSQAWLDQNYPENAQQDLDRVVEMDPDTPDVLILAGSIFEKQGRLDDALAAYDKALELSPKDTQVLNARALVNLFNENPDSAVIDLLKIQAIEGSNFVNSFNLGLAYGQMEGKSKEAFQHFEKAFKKNPGLLKGYFESAGEFESVRLKKVLSTILESVKSVDSNVSGAFYRNELILLLDRKLTEAY